MLRRQRILYRELEALGWQQRHVFAAIGLRPPVGQHTESEGRLLRRYATNARCAVEIGVAEGGSAWEIRQAIDPEGVLYLVDPYPPGRLFGVNMSLLVARRLVGRVDRGEVVWIRQTSHEAVVDWEREIDFIFIDGDHAFDAVKRDWEDWSPHVRVGGVVALHDARPADQGWPTREAGPVRLLEGIRSESPEWQVADSMDTTVVIKRVV